MTIITIANQSTETKKYARLSGEVLTRLVTTLDLLTIIGRLTIHTGAEMKDNSKGEDVFNLQEMANHAISHLINNTTIADIHRYTRIWLVGMLMRTHLEME
jgi:hypothetical protein